MSTETRTVCDECQGVIPTGAQYVAKVTATLMLSTGPTPYGPLDFCCTAHMSSYIAAQPQVGVPTTPYTPIPSQ